MGPRHSLSLCFDAAGLAALRLGVFLVYLTEYYTTEKLILEGNQYIHVYVLKCENLFFTLIVRLYFHYTNVQSCI